MKIAKNTILLLLCLLGFLPVFSSAWAGANSSATAGAGASSKAIVHSNPVASAGALGQGGSAQLDQTLIFEGSKTKIPPQLPNSVTPNIPVPQIFGGLNAPTGVTGIPLIMKYLEKCQPVATRKYDLRDVFADGTSGKTEVTFSPHQNYYKYSDRSKDVEESKIDFLRSKRRYMCLGILTVMAKKDESGVTFTTIISDGRAYPVWNMEGFNNIHLISVKDAIAAALGASNSGSGFSVAPGLVAIASNALSGGALNLGYSGGNGGTYSDARIGTTFLVLSYDDDNVDPIVFDPEELSNAYPKRVHMQESGGNGKKAAAAGDLE